MNRFLLTVCRFASIAICLMLFLSACDGEKQNKILYINSYHDGYPSSDDIRDGIIKTFAGKEVELKICYLDTKRNPEQEKVELKVKEALSANDTFAPDLIIASDDNAVSELVVPHLQTTGLPVVFCGVNWSAGKYDLNENVTGMLEVYPLRECILSIMQVYPDIRTITVLSENTPSEQRNTELLDTLYRKLGLNPDYRQVDTFEEWKTAFTEASSSSGLIYLPTNGAIRNWDSKEAISFVEDKLKVPTITCDDFMMEYCVFGLTKVAMEQGEWAAETAMKILDGDLPSDIPYTKNSRFQAYLNQNLADRISFKLPAEKSLGLKVLK